MTYSMIYDVWKPI